MAKHSSITRKIIKSAERLVLPVHHLVTWISLPENVLLQLALTATPEFLHLLAYFASPSWKAWTRETVIKCLNLLYTQFFLDPHILTIISDVLLDESFMLASFLTAAAVRANLMLLLSSESSSTAINKISSTWCLCRAVYISKLTLPLHWLLDFDLGFLNHIGVQRMNTTVIY